MIELTILFRNFSQEFAQEKAQIEQYGDYGLLSFTSLNNFEPF